MVKFLIAATGTLLIGAAAVWGLTATSNGSKSACATRIVPLSSGSTACRLARQRNEPRARDWLLATK